MKAIASTTNTHVQNESSLLAGGLRPPAPPRYPRGLRPPDPLNSGGLRPPDPLRFWGLRPQTPMKCERGYGSGLTTKPAFGSREGGRPKQWQVTNLVHGGCDSSRLDLRAPIWPAEAATAADLKGDLGWPSCPRKKYKVFQN